MLSPLTPGKSASSDRTQAILAELGQAQQAIEKGDCVELSGTRTLKNPQGNCLEGELTRVSWSPDPNLRVVCKYDDAIVELRSEVLKRNTLGVQAAAAAIGGVIGLVLFGGRKAGAAAGAALGALGAGKAAEGPKLRHIERIQIDSQGVTTERVTLGPDGKPLPNGISYTLSFHRTAAPPPLDPKAAKDYLDHLQLDPPKQ